MERLCCLLCDISIHSQNNTILERTAVLLTVSTSGTTSIKRHFRKSHRQSFSGLNLHLYFFQVNKSQGLICTIQSISLVGNEGNAFRRASILDAD